VTDDGGGGGCDDDDDDNDYVTVTQRNVMMRVFL
jgi:hypothetical protein